MNQLQLTKSDHGKTVSARLGDEAVITLDENQTTGYRWAVDKLDADFIEVRTSDYTLGSGTAVGGGGIRRITLLLKKAGSVRLELKLRREWERDSQGIDHFVIDFVIGN